MPITNKDRKDPFIKRYFAPTKELLKKHPRLLYLVQHGKDEPLVMMFGPDETGEEKRSRLEERRRKKEVRMLLKKTKASINQGKQKKMSHFVIRK